MKRVRDTAGGGGEEGKLLNLMNEEKNIKEQLRDLHLSELDRVKLQTELEKKHNEVLDQRHKMEQDAAKKKEESDEKELRHKQRIDSLQREINNAKREETDAEDEIQDRHDKATRLSLDELADSQFRMTGDLGHDQGIAREIKLKTKQMEWNRKRGYYHAADARFDEIAALRAQLSTANFSPDELDPNRRLEEQIRHAKDTADAVTKLLKIEQSGGLSIKPKMGN